MKKLTYMILLLILIMPTVSAVMTQISIPLVSQWRHTMIGGDNQTVLELKNRNTRVIYKRYEISENETYDEEWNLYYTLESTDYCPGEIAGGNFSESFYNMSVSLGMMIEAFNESSNLSKEVILMGDLMEKYGSCNATAGLFQNRTRELETENKDLQSQLTSSRRYETRYDTCEVDLANTKKALGSRLMIGIGAGLIIYHFVAGSKKNRPEEAEHESWAP